MAEEQATAAVAKRKPGRPKGSGKRGPKPGKKRGRKPGAKRGPKAGAGLLGKVVAKQVKAALKSQNSATKAFVRSLVATELKRAFKAL